MGLKDVLKKEFARFKSNLNNLREERYKPITKDLEIMETAVKEVKMNRQSSWFYTVCKTRKLISTTPTSSVYKCL